MDWMRIFEDGLRSGIGLVAAVFALTAVGLNLQFGYTGLANFGQAGFLLVGAYGTAITVDKWDLPLGVGFLVGVAAAVVLGLLLGIPTLRLRADYLAIVTISAAEILRIARELARGPGPHRRSAGHRRLRRRVLRPQPVQRSRHAVRRGVVHRARPVGHRRARGARSRCSASARTSRSTARGAASSRRSARTRTRRARSARTSTRTRCRAWSSAA